jgi:hypothetical protein
VKHVALAALAAGLIMAGVPGAFAGERPGYQFSSYSPRPMAQSSASAGNVERRCIKQSCGSVWCYTVRR